MLYAEIIFLILGILGCIVGFLNAISPPARRKTWSLLRAGLAYAMLVVRKWQSDKLEDEKRKTEPTPPTPPNT